MGMPESAYLAGIIDGEGNIGIQSRGKGHQAICVVVSNTDARLVEWLKREFGGNVRLQAKQIGNRKPCWQWRVYHRQAERVILSVYPYLRLKREQADVALAWQRLSRRPGARFLSIAALEERDQLFQTIRVFNRKGVA